MKPVGFFGECPGHRSTEAFLSRLQSLVGPGNLQRILGAELQTRSLSCFKKGQKRQEKERKGRSLMKRDRTNAYAFTCLPVLRTFSNSATFPFFLIITHTYEKTFNYHFALRCPINHVEIETFSREVSVLTCKSH